MKRRGARRVRDRHAPAPDRHRALVETSTVVPGIVRDRDVRAGQGAEESALADVRVADEDDPVRPARCGHARDDTLAWSGAGRRRAPAR